MKTKAQPRFDTDALRDLAGEKVFARGNAYHHDGHVQILSLEPQRVLAEVAGTEDYRTVLTGRGKKIGGECSCPAFDDWGFCKHMVAAALAANDVGSDAEAEGVGALARIRDYLKKKGTDALVEMIVDMAERDGSLFRRLDLAAAAVHADDKTLEARLRRAIDTATRTGSFVDYAEAAGWAEAVNSALDAVAELASGPRAGLALKLADRATDKLEQALGEIDDSNGECYAALERARDIHLTAALAARPDPIVLAHDLFARETDGEYDIFDGAAALYADVLGEKGLAEYRRLATALWEKLPPRGHREQLEFSSTYRRLATILDFFAARDDDMEMRIALRSKDLSSPWNYLQLAEFCLAQGREKEALRHAEEGLWVFEDGRSDSRLVFLVADLLVKADRKSEAEVLLWRAFEKIPSLEFYTPLSKLGGKTARERAVTFLETCLAEETRTPRSDPADLLIRILMQDKMFEVAWAAVQKHGASIHTKEELAEASEATHPHQALAVYVARVEQFINAGGDRAYAEAVKWITRMAGLRSAAEQANYVAALKARHGRKRNFMKLLG
jgi:hypothetical protein